MPTLTDETTFDAIVVGAGPAGSCAASFLARAGRRVLLLDKARFPRPKPCGDAVSGKSVGVLREPLGLQDLVEEQPHAMVDSVLLSSPAGCSVSIPFPRNVDSGEQARTRRYDYVTAGYVIQREVFDNTLFEFARSQDLIETVEGFEVNDVLLDSPRCCVVVGHDADGTERRMTARTVIGADGATSAVARAVGVFDRDPAHWVAAYRSYFQGVQGLGTTLEIHFLDDVLPGYFWIFPVADGMANVGVGVLEAEVKASKRPGSKREINMRQSMYRVIAEHPMFRQRFAGATELLETRKGWLLPLGSKRRVIHGEGWVLVGDAASLIDPFSGEGIGNAMVSARLAAEVIHEALAQGDDRPAATALAPYADRVWDEMGDELRSSHRLQRLARHGWLVDFILRRAARSADVRQILSSMLAEAEQKKQFGDLRFYLKLLVA